MIQKERYIWKDGIKQLEENEKKVLNRPDLKAVFKTWKDISEELQGTEKYGKFYEELKRSWSIETGIIENVYSLSEGATRTLVEEGFKASLISRDDTDRNPDELIDILNSHREGIDFVMDIIGGERELTVGSIKELHALVTRHQETAKARDIQGKIVEVPLLRGTWKEKPNNPVSPEGEVCMYCPPEQVTVEMEKLITYYASLSVEDISPALVSAWLHHRFTQIHPFQDGNGRMARYLANLVFIKAEYLPLVISRHERTRYIKALEAADKADVKFSLTELVDFFADVQKKTLIRAISLAEEILSKKDEIKDIIKGVADDIREKGRIRKKRLAGVEAKCTELSDRIETRFDGIAADINSNIGDMKASVRRSERNKTERYYNRQIITLKPDDWWVDLNSPVYWVNLFIIYSKEVKFDFTVSIFNVGRLASGIIGVAAFYETRLSDEDRLGDDPQQLGDFFTFTIDQSLSEIEAEFEKWLNEASVKAITIWREVTT